MITVTKTEHRLIHSKKPPIINGYLEIKYNISSDNTRLSNLLNRSFKNSNSRRINDSMRDVALRATEFLLNAKPWKNTSWEHKEMEPSVKNGMCVYCGKIPWNPIVICTCRMA